MSLRTKILGGFLLSIGILFGGATLGVSPLLRMIKSFDHAINDIGEELSNLSTLKTLVCQLYLDHQNPSISPDVIETKKKQALENLSTYIQHAVNSEELIYHNKFKNTLASFYENPSEDLLKQMLSLIDEAVVTEYEEIEEYKKQSKIYREEILKTSLWVLSLSGLFSIFMAVMVSTKLSKPLKELLQALHRVGEENSPLLKVGGKDEIGQLSQRYNEMVTRLNQTMIHRDQLEHKVNERTLSLEKEQQARKAMAQILVHDLSNALFGIKGELQILSQSSSTLNNLGSLHNAIEEMENMVGDILTVYRMERNLLQVKKSMFDAGKVISETALQFWKANDEKKMTIQCLPPEPASCMVCTDLALFKRILQNLLKNALRYAPEYSQIDVSWSIHEGAIFELRVRDYGKGIPDACKQSIFESFVQLEPSSQGLAGGLGLGLSFCKMASEKLAATLKVQDSNPGAEFIFSLSL